MAGLGVARLGVACLRAKEKNTYSLMMCIFIGIAIVRSWSTLKAKCQFHCGSQGIKEDTRFTMLRFHKISAFPYFPAREYVRMDAVGAQTRRSLGQHLLHPLI